MKSTYKLFGAFWDGMKAVKYDDLNIKNSPESSEPISFRRLLSVQNETDLGDIVAQYKTSEVVAITIDYWAESANPVLCAFLKKRLCQMVGYLAEKHAAVRCVWAENTRQVLPTPDGCVRQIQVSFEQVH